MTDAKGFMKLNDDELEWLEGKIRIFDVQKGCPVQCITCGLSAPRYGGSIAWKDFMEISESIRDVSISRGIHLLGENTFYPFLLSDPAYYHSKDGKQERTIYDVIKTLHNQHSKYIPFTTSGWTPGNNYMQRAVEHIVESINTGNKYDISVMYSVKTVSERAIKEYTKFLQESSSPSTEKKQEYADRKFIKKSVFARHLSENIKTMKSLKGEIFSLQHISDVVFLNGLFLDKYSPYKSLFSEKFVDKLYSTCCHAVNVSCLNTTGGRDFAGAGRALDVGISEDGRHSRYLDSIIKRDSLSDSYYNPIITGEGKIRIFYGLYSTISQIPVPKEHFQILAQQNRDSKDLYDKYMMLSELQGKSLID